MPTSSRPRANHVIGSVILIAALVAFLQFWVIPVLQIHYWPYDQETLQP